MSLSGGVGGNRGVVYDGPRSLLGTVGFTGDV